MSSSFPLLMILWGGELELQLVLIELLGIKREVMTLEAEFHALM